MLRILNTLLLKDSILLIAIVYCRLLVSSSLWLASDAFINPQIVSILRNSNAFIPSNSPSTPKRRRLVNPKPNHKSSSTNTIKMKEIETEEREEAVPTWCPEQQIYVGGVVPDHSEVEQLIADNDGYLRIFGYGSLCWNPGSGSSLSKFEEGVTRTLGRAVGWKRCWSQKSADHRGTPEFPGLVCTLLTDGEVRRIRLMSGSKKGNSGIDSQKAASDVEGETWETTMSMTEGLIYTVPPAFVQDCLSELDFREKGGYARDVIDVIEDETGKTVKALLYRGTPENPAFFKRALLDLPYAAAIMAVSIGPSGHNDVYLYNLEKFLKDAESSSPAAAASFEDHTGDWDTRNLGSMARSLQKHDMYFLFGSGSNQHNQLLLSSPQNGACLLNGDEAHDLKEIVLVVPPCAKPSCSTNDSIQNENIPVPPPKTKRLFAGGGHSGLLTEDGSLYLWGWNEYGQLGHKEYKATPAANNEADVDENSSPISVIKPLHSMKVRAAALGHTHTLVVEYGTRKLYAFGDNGRGQVDGTTDSPKITHPTIVSFLAEEEIIDIGAGLFHSAVITSTGELVTFGCGRFGQSFKNGINGSDSEKSSVSVGRWRPHDGTRLTKVACGRRHTIMLDERGRIWTMGDNKYGQLGRGNGATVDKDDESPRLVDGILGKEGSGCYDIACGWSHNIGLVKDKNSPAYVSVYGWGRNDKGQLGTGYRDNVETPHLIHGSVGDKKIQTCCCGAESSMALDEDGDMWGCGWNEHGNLSIGQAEDALLLTRIVGTRITKQPLGTNNADILMAVGGAHFITLME